MGRVTTAWLAALALVACGDDAEQVDRGLSAEIVEVSTEMLDPSDDARDDVTLTVSYRDGNGDLGGGLAEVHDCRAAGLVTTLPIPEIANEQAVADAVPIFGDLALTVQNVGLVVPDPDLPGVCEQGGAPAASESSVTFCVQLTDALGEQSAPACTEAIQIAQ